MSDPVTHAEIEDVLSSIRRLVSEDSRGQPAAPEPAARLVLTPALRVKDPQTRSPEPADRPDTPGSTPQPDEAPAQDAAAAARPAQDAEPAQDAGRTEDAADGTAADSSVSFRHRDARSDSTSGPVSESGPVVLRPAEKSEPESVAEPAQPGGAAAQAPWADPDATLFSAASGTAPQDAPAGGLAEDLAGGTAGARAASVVRKIAELEARSSGARDQAQQQWEPDSKTEAPFAATLVDTIEWRDEPAPVRSSAQAESGADFSPAEEILEAAGEPVEAADAVTAAETVVEAAFTGAAMDALAESGDSYLDEEALRDLVASIVREELQGPLGERITRNVRKLVRREIHRALAAHDLL
ncbi:hypothetical protein K3718_05270 [Leisingera aquaemixtae]|uniref:Uncharacterized protein n=1 Tax=Leisingera aquaemixtae TaxID=1396826 RepID=A0ABY5WM45_9RHOB|nr:hypothetical protein [Leisingera aquaemixtae]UWQ42502.1 hypothetical protein K3718_05270 [Leisingera aquaemixtae]